LTSDEAEIFWKEALCRDFRFGSVGSSSSCAAAADAATPNDEDDYDNDNDNDFGKNNGPLHFLKTLRIREEAAHSFEDLFAFYNGQTHLRVAISSSSFRRPSHPEEEPQQIVHVYDHVVCMRLCNDSPDDYVGSDVIDNK